MILDPIRPEVPAVRVIPHAAPDLAARLGLPSDRASLGLLTCTSDDCLYAALDAGTKAADVEVVYAKSFYAGASHASGPFSGEAIGVLAGPDPDAVAAGLAATLDYLRERACFYAADDAGRLAFFPHLIPAAGRYLARLADVPPGTSLAYLIAPPIEALLGMDAALKEARVELRVFYGPPSETNYGGGLLAGDQTACQAAAEAFQRAVLDLARRPRLLPGPAPALEAALEALPPPTLAARRYRRHDTGEELDLKPAGLTHLFDDRSLVPKSHPVIRLRGAIDLLQAQLLDARITARAEGRADIDAALGELLVFLRDWMAAEVAGRPCPVLRMAGFDAEELHRISHHTRRYLGVGFLLPDADLGPTAVKLNLLRAQVRQAELAAVDAFAGDLHVAPDRREPLLAGLNRLSNAVYVLTCRLAADRSPAGG